MRLARHPPRFTSTSETTPTRHTAPAYAPYGSAAGWVRRPTATRTGRGAAKPLCTSSGAFGARPRAYAFCDVSRTFRVAVGLCTYPAAAPCGAYAGAVCRVGVAFEVPRSAAVARRRAGSKAAVRRAARQAAGDVHWRTVSCSALNLAFAALSLTVPRKETQPTSVSTSTATPTRRTAPAYAPHGAAAK